MTQHSLAVGNSLSSKYGLWGISNRRMIKPLNRIFGLAFGPPNCGKTSLFSWCPGALIINCDGSSTPVPDPSCPPPLAQFWPGFNDKGEPIGPDDKPFVLTWERIRETAAKLVEAAEKGLPRPELVVLDSVYPSLNLIKTYLIAKEATKPGRAHVKEWKQMFGESAWEDLYGELLNFYNMLSPHYGVWFIGHLTDKWKKVGDADVSFKELTTPDGFKSRFNPLFELAICLDARLVPAQVTTFHEIPGVGKIEKTETIMKKRVFLTGEIPELAKLYKQRIALSVNLELPPTKEWETLSAAYQKSATIPA